MYNKGKQFENHFFIYWPKCKKKCIFWGYFGGPEGVFNDQTNLSCFPAILSYLCTCEIRKQSDKTFLSLNPKYEKIIKNFIFGGSWGALRRTQVNENFRALRPHNRADKFITREKNNHQFFIYGPQCEKMRILGYSGGPGWPINNPTGPILLPRHPLTYINLHIKYGSNPIRIFLSYRENDEVSADAADAADAAA